MIAEGVFLHIFCTTPEPMSFTPCCALAVFAALLGFLHFRKKFARVGHPFATHHYKRGRRKVSFASYKKMKEVDKRKKQLHLSNKGKRQSAEKIEAQQSPEKRSPFAHCRIHPCYHPTRIPHNHTRPILNF